MLENLSRKKGCLANNSYCQYIPYSIKYIQIWTIKSKLCYLQHEKLKCLYIKLILGFHFEGVYFLILVIIINIMCQTCFAKVVTVVRAHVIWWQALKWYKIWYYRLFHILRCRNNLVVYFFLYLLETLIKTWTSKLLFWFAFGDTFLNKGTAIQLVMLVNRKQLKLIYL